MEHVTIQQIIAIARQESVELKHYFVGVEHLFIALTRLKGGVTADLVERRGLLGYFMNYISREAFGKGDEQRYWPDFRFTTRAEKVLRAAQDAIARGVYPEDRALLLAILEEGDSVPIRILQEVGADTAALYKSVKEWTSGTPIIPPSVPIIVEQADLQLAPAHERVLRQMFRDADTIYVKRSLQDGFSGAVVLLVQVVRARLLNAPVVVKLDDKESIQYERLRYDQWVKQFLPPNTASIVDEPTILPDNDIGGIKYTFVHKPGTNSPLNLRQFALEHGSERIVQFIREALYDTFHPYWWGQGQTYRFQVWQEYELLLPPALIVQLISEEDARPTPKILYPGGSWSRTGGVSVGETVMLDNFVAQRVRPERGSLQVSAGAAAEASARASRIDIRGIDYGADVYFRGQPVRRLFGRVLKTRNDILLEQIQALEPPFDILADFLPALTDGLTLPNPIKAYVRLLDRWVDGLISPIHGDLHTGNILIGPAGDAWLIDFEWTRLGHTLLDWAVLETSLLTDLVAPLLDESWDTAWDMIRVLDTLNRRGEFPANTPPELIAVLEPIREVRRIARTLLAPPNMQWSEYFIALAMCAIRVPSWANRPLAARRLMFLSAALYMDAIGIQEQSQTDTDTRNKTVRDMRRFDDGR